MNKSELVARLTERLGGDRAMATAAVNGVLEEIQGSVASGERVSLTGFGTFDRRERAARMGRNPQTGATIQLAASVSPVFRPGTGFRSLLSENGGSPTVEPVVQAQAAPDVAPKKAKNRTKKAKKAAPAESGTAGKKTTKKAASKDAKKAAKKRG
jgi:DNA-binding protein HU-beta